MSIAPLTSPNRLLVRSRVARALPGTSTIRIKLSPIKNIKCSLLSTAGIECKTLFLSAAPLNFRDFLFLCNLCVDNILCVDAYLFVIYLGYILYTYL